MQFIGRRNELRALERHFQSQRFEFLVVYGVSCHLNMNKSDKFV